MLPWMDLDDIMLIKKKQNNLKGQILFNSTYRIYLQ